MKKTRTLLLALLTAAGLVHADYDDWSGHRTITLNTTASGADVAGDVENFPVLVRLGPDEAGIIAAAKAGGADIRFSKADDETALPYEIESWGPAGAAIWVLVDEIEGDNDTQTIRMHWGNPDAEDESDGTAVFGTANDYVSVWHMNGDSTETSSTEQAFVATPFNDPGVNPGAAIGPGRMFDGTQHMQILGSAESDMNFLADTTYTFSAWVRNDSLVITEEQAGHAVLTKGDYQWALAVYGGSAPDWHYEITTHAGNWSWHQTTTAAVDSPAYAGDYINDHVGEWRHMVGTWDGSPLNASTGRIYLDGVLQKEMVFNVSSTTQQVQTARDVHIGVLSNHGADNTEPTGNLQRYFIGSLDEITVSSVARSADWIKLSYENQKAENSLTDIGQPAPIGYDDWSESREITLNTSATGADVAGDVHNFPVLIRLGEDESDILSEANNDGSDIRFSKMDGVTPLPYEIESWSEDAAVIWVLVDLIEGDNADQSIMMYWGNDDAPSYSNGAAVFNPANGHSAVWHLNGSEDETDATGNGFDATAMNEPTSEDGVIGPARTFDGADQYFVVPNSASSALNYQQTDSYTLSSWIKPAAISEDGNTGHKIIDKGDNQYVLATYGPDAATRYWEITIKGNGTWNQCQADGALEGADEILASSSVGDWHHLVGTYTGGAVGEDVVQHLYYDGQLVAECPITNTDEGGRTETFDVHLGVQAEGSAPGTAFSRYWNGQLDEPRMANVARSADWVKLEYASQSPFQTLTDIGVTEPDEPGAPTGVTGTPSTTTTGAINVSWTAPEDNGGVAITEYTVTGSPDGECTTDGATSCVVTDLTPGEEYTFTVVATNSAGDSEASDASDAVEAPTAVLPGSFVIRMDGNPYSYRIPASAAATTEQVTMTISDMQGKRVWSRTINPSAGKAATLTWDGRNTSGMQVSAGMYIVRINATVNGVNVKAIRKNVNLNP